MFENLLITYEGRPKVDIFWIVALLFFQVWDIFIFIFQLKVQGLKGLQHVIICYIY